MVADFIKYRDLKKLNGKKLILLGGKPSDDILIAKLHGEEICFIPRHSRGHKINPSNINFRAMLMP